MTAVAAAPPNASAAVATRSATIAAATAPTSATIVSATSSAPDTGTGAAAAPLHDLPALVVGDLVLEVAPPSDRKTIEIVVERDASLVLKAPPTATIERARQFVTAKRPWVYRKLAEKDALTGPPVVKQFVELTWNRFCEAVKFETRFVFWLLPDDDDLGAGEIPPAKILDQIGPLIDQLDLIRELPAGYRLWRAHTHEEHAIEHSAARLGTAPREFALKANRMSPAGIPMFYGSTDAGTAIREVACKSGDAYVTWGQFEFTASLAVADFTRLPAEPSMFDPELGSVRRHIRFLNMFVNQLSDRAQPQHEQIDYVPTQIVTEYLLRIHGGGNRSRGLTYQSSLTAETCMALDVRDDHCLDPTGAPPDASVHLKLVADSVECRSITEADRSI